MPFCASRKFRVWEQMAGHGAALTVLQGGPVLLQCLESRKAEAPVRDLLNGHMYFSDMTGLDHYYHCGFVIRRSSRNSSFISRCALLPLWSVLIWLTPAPPLLSHSG
jgi:hypothetical protein